MITKQERYLLRKERTRKKLFKNGITKPRLSVKKSNKYIYTQVIDDIKGITIASASSIEKEILEQIKKTQKSAKSVEAAKILGKIIAERAISKGVKEVIFDRGGSIYHGKIKALADAAREAGLKF
jgi:large subunit ribosomal protein L18